jgi:hypothetical protein
MTDAMSIDNNIYQKRVLSKEAQFLEQKLEAIEDEQGFLGNIWNGIKEITTLGVSQSDCESMLEKYNNGEISFEEAVNYLDEFDSKQENMSNLLSNILTGAGTIAAASAILMTGGWAAVGVKGIASLALKHTGFTWLQAFKYGAPIGALLKTAINFTDRATNDVEGDALDGKQIAKDAISGALTGAASAVSSASSIGYKTLVDKNIIQAGTLVGDMAKGALCGVECGAMSGAAGYMTDVAFGDKEFNFGDLTTNTLTSAFVSGTVGAAVGSATHGMDMKHIAQAVTDKGKILKDSLLSSSRKVGGQIEREALDL